MTPRGSEQEPSASYAAGEVARLREQDVTAAEAPSPVPGVSRNVFLLGWVSLVTDIASEMAYPLIPVFLTTTLGAPVAVMGVIEGVAEGTASTMKVASGWVSDRVGRRKPLVVAGYALSVLGKALLALAFAWPQAFLARFVDRTGKGLRTSPRDALIADGTEPRLRGRVFGFHRAMDTAGAVIGPSVALALVAAGVGPRPVLLLALAPGVMGVALLAAVKDRPTRRALGSQPLGPSAPGLRPAGGPSRGYWAFIGIIILFSLGNSSDAFLLLRARDLGLNLGEVIAAYVLFNASYSLLAMPAGVLSDRLGRYILLTGGLLVFAGVYLGFGLAPGGRWLWPLFLVYGIYMAATEGVGRALATDLAPELQRGTYLGVYHTGIGIATVLASVTAGLLWDRVGPASPFLLGAGVSLLSAGLMLALPALVGRPQTSLRGG